MIGEFYELLEKIADRGHLVPFLAGGFLASAATWWLMRHWPSGLIHELRNRIGELEQQQRQATQRMDTSRRNAETLRRERDSALAAAKQSEGRCEALRERLTQTSESCERIGQDRAKLYSYVKLFRKERGGLIEQVNRLSDQIDSIAADDGRLWLRPKGDGTPGHLPLGSRKVPIISVANLKGGVGKTTITANLGVTFAAGGSRVLLIDLDHQSSLSMLCMDFKERAEAKRSHRTVANLFRGRGGLDALNANTIEIELAGISGRLYLAPAVEAFADLENQLAHRWAAGLEHQDVRFILREALHDQGIIDTYDLVLIDCPPRLTTGCANALAASDFALVPVLLQDTSAEAVPRMLSWLRRFRDGVSEHLDLVGIVGNRAYPRSKLIAREDSVWKTLRDRCTEAWGHGVPLLDEIIREHSTCTGRFAALEPKHRTRYERLAREIREAIPHACFPPATVHPVAGPTVDGVGH